MRIVTHDSLFHTDDVCAVATLLLLLGDAEVVRSRDPKERETADYVVDVGMTYDTNKHLFDHHQPEGAGIRPNGIPYASFGLVWKEYGAKLAGGVREAEIIDQKLVQAVDAHDNGVTTARYTFDGVEEYSLGDYFRSFIESRDPTHLYDTFMHVVGLAKDLIVREIRLAQTTIADEEKLTAYYQSAPDKRLIVLEEDLKGWGKFLREKPEVLYVIHPRPDGKWSLGAIQDDYYISRKSLPKSWAGLSDEKLQQVSGVPDALFCHRNLFMGAAKSREGAVQMAEIALNS